MNNYNVSQVIRELFRQNYTLYPSSYSDNIGPAIDAAKETAKGYWDNRTPEEERRDRNALVTLQDYENWCVDELTALKKEAINN